MHENEVKEMEIIIDTMYCKTNDIFFDKEKTGVKPNTVRLLNTAEKDQLLNKIWKVKYVVIESLEDNNNSFSRNITDISFFDDYMIISWNHNSAGDPTR